MRVILVDDNPDDRTLTRREIERALPHAELMEVGTADELEGALGRGGPIDIAVLDFSLGWSDGLSVFKRIRATDPDCAAVLFTGSLGEDGAVAAMKAGIDDYVVKGRERLPRLHAALLGLARRRSEREALRRAEGRYRELWTGVSVGVFATGGDGRLLDANPAMADILGLEDAGGADLRAMLEDTDGAGLWREAAGAGIAGREVALRTPSGRTVSALLDLRPVPGDGGEMEGLLTDVTALRRALDERELLMREIVHRVYNNLQLILALIDMEAAGYRSEPVVVASFQRLAARVRAIAAVQRRLMKGGDLTNVPLDEFICEVATGVDGTLGRDEILIECDVEPVTLPVDRAIPLGMIAGELITNAFKHAFPAGRRGRVAVRLQRAGELVRLTVADDGAGMPDAAGRREGVGSQLVRSLVRQVDGTLTLDNGPGTSVTVAFQL
ncbi:MAG TPA: histidine kinase dimerization/phosphoacceptor domain -containing protein [Azospirillaceae bacterium]|nr:histidine kinase dimerization/phosphoacceptor domain -containing protein [Azospirillaceae bacterium]